MQVEKINLKENKIPKKKKNSQKAKRKISNLKIYQK